MLMQIIHGYELGYNAQTQRVLTDPFFIMRMIGLMIV